MIIDFDKNDKIDHPKVQNGFLQDLTGQVSSRTNLFLFDSNNKIKKGVCFVKTILNFGQ